MKRAPSPRPDWIEICAIEHGSGNVIDFPMVQDLPSLLWVVNLGCIDLNQWYARCDDVDRPDYLHFDLDPVKGADVRAGAARPRCVVRDGARRRSGCRATRRPPARAASTSTCRSCAGPTQKEVWGVAKALAQALAAARPGLITAEYRIAKRPAGPRAGGLQPERVGAHAGLGLLGAAAPARRRVDAGDLGGGRARRRASRTSASTTCPPGVARHGDLFEAAARAAPAASGSSACCEPAARAALPADGGAARGRDPGRAGLAVRAQVGRLPLPRVPRRRPDRAPVEGRPAAGALLPRGGRRTCARSRPARFVLDGEIVIPLGGRLSFDDLLQRIHPAASRVERLSRERPAVLIVFDLLVDARGQGARRAAAPRSAGGAWRPSRRKALAGRDDIRLSPATRGRGAGARMARHARAARSTASSPSGSTCRTRPASATGMQKVKRRRTADCVVGGFRYASGRGWSARSSSASTTPTGCSTTSASRPASRPPRARRSWPSSSPLIKPPGFTGRAPGGPSRWSTERSAEWEPLEPKLVVEVSYDHFTGDRFRHGTRFLRWRPDKAPRQCTLDQVAVSTREPGLPGSAAAPRPGSAAGSPRRAPSTSRRSSAGSRRRAGRR